MGLGGYVLMDIEIFLPRFSSYLLEEVHCFLVSKSFGPGLFCKLRVKLKLDVT